MSRLDKVASFLLWPGILAACVVGFHLGSQAVSGVVAFNVSYISLAATLFLLERARPHQDRWLERDGQMLTDFLHTAFSKSVAQVIVVFVTVLGVAKAAGGDGGPFWPSHWPLWAQVAGALVLGEFALYWAHRLAHEWPLLWRFHAIHHSATRLWFWNTGRFHIVDTAVSMGSITLILFAAGAPDKVMIWVSAITAYIGMLTHCNIRMSPGPLNLLFNTPVLHRWHHSPTIEEGNTNYGENLMIWDLVFGTYFNPPRRAPVNIGIGDPMPVTFLGQLAHPFRNRTAPDQEVIPPVARRAVESSSE